MRRSTLKPYYRKDRRQWTPRGTYPEKDAAGRVTWKRGYLGAGSDTRAACQDECDRLNRELEAAAQAGQKASTFEEAVLVYLRTGGDGRFLTDRLLDQIGHVRCDEFTDKVMTDAQAAIYPTAAKSTINRQLYTPVIAVLNLAAQGQAWKVNLRRPKGHTKLKPAHSPADQWFMATLPLMRPAMRALILFCTIHGPRVGNAIRCRRRDFDGEALQLLDKNGTYQRYRLAPVVAEAIQALDHGRDELFWPLTPASRSNVFRELRRVCERAAVEYFTPHKIGRHAFAKRMLREGYSLAHVASAGGWNNIKVVGELYGAFERDEAQAAAGQVGSQWAGQIGSGSSNVVPLPKRSAG